MKMKIPVVSLIITQNHRYPLYIFVESNSGWVGWDGRGAGDCSGRGGEYRNVSCTFGHQESFHETVTQYSSRDIGTNSLKFYTCTKQGARAETRIQ